MLSYFKPIYIIITMITSWTALLFFFLDDLLPSRELDRQTPTRGYKHQAGNNQSLSNKHWFNVYDLRIAQNQEM